jgi:hypothetical protein
MTTLTRDRCLTCGAWLVLAEVHWVGPTMRQYPGVGCRAVYECPNCTRLFETWAHDAAPLEPMSRSRRHLRSLVALRGPHLNS